MSSDRESDAVDYVSDNAERDEETMFLPAPDARPDHGTFLFAGILAGLGGGALVPVSPWLAGGLIFIGYGLAALTFRGARGGIGSALRFGFGITAILGAALLLGEIAAPHAIWRLVSSPGDRPIIFPGFAVMPWFLAFLHYVYRLIR